MLKALLVEVDELQERHLCLAGLNLGALAQLIPEFAAGDFPVGGFKAFPAELAMSPEDRVISLAGGVAVEVFADLDKVAFTGVDRGYGDGFGGGFHGTGYLRV